MALVAYDNSDSSEYEDDDQIMNATPKINTNTDLLASPKLPDPIQDELNISEGGREFGSLFTLLPQPSNKKPVVIEEDDEFLHKKETGSNIQKPKAKITVPSLSDFKDVEDCTPLSKPKINNGKKNGLLSMLPQPRHTLISTKSLIPNVLTKKPANKEPLPSQIKKSKIDNKITLDYSDDSDNDEVQNDFFSINKPIDIPIEELPLDVGEKEDQGKNNVPSQKVPRSIESYFKKDSVGNQELQIQNGANAGYYEENASSSQSYNYAEPVISNEVVLDEEAILKLCGSRGKRKREEIQILDINQQEVLDDAKEMLRKGLLDDTSKRMSSSKRKGNEPTSQQKRKHQITYLAYQAKANETELQNQWANNRMSKRQTQSKYGF